LFLLTFDYFGIKMNIKMKNSRYFLLILLFCVINASIFAQNAAQNAAQNREYTPYVSDIKAEARNNLIRLTWTDSPDARGRVFIFRSIRPFGGSIPANIRPVVVRYGEQYYVDDTDDMQNIYYFIAASDTAGRRYDIILPRINSTSLIPDNEDALPTVVLSPPASSPSEPIDGIYNLRANQDGDRVTITFDMSDRSKSAILYRSSQPVRVPLDLLNAVIVQSGIRSPFTDSPVPGISWYYAIIHEDEIQRGDVKIRSGVNATVSAITIYSDQAKERSLRPIPLPLMTLNNAVESHFITEIPNQIPLNPVSSNLLRETDMPRKKPIVLRNPRVFSVDLVAPTGGEDSALFQIIMEYFVKFEWEKAQVRLEHYLSLPRSKEIEARTRFYLGQTLYYAGNYKEALMEFLSFRTHYLAEANVWIDAVLSAIVY